MCTIATAKVQRNYNCHNVYFYECLQIIRTYWKILSEYLRILSEYLRILSE